jgi:cellulose synthase/poly-beta-1,6-N-acetylglucosamine synthase-like glycosyltransferase
VCYSLLIIYYWLSWRKIPEFVSRPGKLQTRFSVVIPARNEEENIVACLRSVCNQDYPVELLQIITVDDCSTDKTWDYLKGFYHPKREIFKVRLTGQESQEFLAHKKRAIQTGIFKSHSEWIVTTDADCTQSPKWLTTIDSFYQERKSVFIAAPVILENNSSTVQIFQALDFLVLQGITGASVHKKIHAMCNGANLAYEKKIFEEVKGFDGIDNIASGDDMLLMNKIWKKFPGKVHYLKSKDAIVSTQPMKTWKEFFNQRIRWASKARFYNDQKIFGILLLVYLFNLSFLILLVAGFWSHVLWLYLIGLIIAKTVIEFPFVYSVAAFFNKRSLLKYFFFFQPLHIAYTIIAGWLGQFGKYEWKGRTVK